MGKMLYEALTPLRPLPAPYHGQLHATSNIVIGERSYQPSNRIT